MGELKKCPCGDVPEDLSITSEGSCKYAYVSGFCCGEWEVEFRTNYHDLVSIECKALAIDAWNGTKRGFK